MIRIIRLHSSALALVICAGPFLLPTARADVVYLSRSSDVRLIDCSAGPPCVDAFHAATSGFEDFSQDFSASRDDAVMQLSALGPGSISATMRSAKSFLNQARSTMTVQFLLDAPMFFGTSGQAQYFGDGGSAGAQLTGPNGPVQLITGSGPGASTVLNFYNTLGTSRLLDAGTYTLSLFAIANGSRISPVNSLNFAMNFAPVPLPAAFVTFLPALAGLGLWRRKSAAKAA